MSPRASLCSVGYTYREHTASVAFAHAAAHGYEYAELRDYRGCAWDDDGVGSSWIDLADEARRAGIQPWACFRSIRLGVPHGTGTTLEQGRRWLAAMRQAGLKLWHSQLLVDGVGSSADASAELIEQGAVLVASIAQLAQDEGVVFALETHMGTLHDTADGLWGLLTAVPTAARASLDFANLLIADPDTDLMAEIRRFSARIAYVHIKNICREDGGWHWNTPVSQGIIDYRCILAELRQYYQGPLGIEYCGSGDARLVSEEDARYLHALAGLLQSHDPYTRSA